MRAPTYRPQIVAEAIKKAGGVTRLADLLGVDQSAVSQWKRIPAERVIAVSKITKIPRKQLRPDLYGSAA